MRRAGACGMCIAPGRSPARRGEGPPPAGALRRAWCGLRPTPLHRAAEPALAPTLHPRNRLVIVRAGDGSLHREWIAGERRDFDLFVSYYGDRPGRYQGDAEYYEQRRGPKWPCLAALLQQHPALLERYDAFWLPDDDISATPQLIGRMFALFQGFELSLAQPALTRDSPCSWDVVRQRPGCVLRYARFVEVMAPLFSRAALRTCLPSFAESRSGWGLDWLWPALCAAGDPRAMAILDATPVRHTRPPGGELYRRHPALDPQRDEHGIVEKYGLHAQRIASRYTPVLSAVRDVALPLPERLWRALRRLNALRRQARHPRRRPACPDGPPRP